jgi:hypothetical protein
VAGRAEECTSGDGDSACGWLPGFLELRLASGEREVLGWRRGEHMPDPIVAYVDFLDGIRRPVNEEIGGRQYVYDDDGEKVYGVWCIPREECDRPIIVDERPF